MIDFGVGRRIAGKDFEKKELGQIKILERFELSDEKVLKIIFSA